MTNRKRNPFLRYLWAWLATMAALLTAIAGLNLVVDPYGAYSWASPSALDAYRPGTGGRIGKAGVEWLLTRPKRSADAQPRHSGDVTASFRATLV